MSRPPRPSLDVVSSTHLAQRFKELFGVTPEWLAYNFGFTASVFAIDTAGPFDWGEDLAGGAGYFDQAHSGQEFRAFTGLTPTRYVPIASLHGCGGADRSRGPDPIRASGCPRRESRSRCAAR